MPAYFNNTLYYGASGRTLKAFSITNARLSSTATSASAASFGFPGATPSIDRKSTRLNSSHSQISYAVFCLKKKKKYQKSSYKYQIARLLPQKTHFESPFPVRR